jgi:hypothetical protein
MWWRKQVDPALPWYRRPDYKGQMTEANKRKLDVFRDQDVHPSARFEDLPPEAQGYISRLEIENYDFKQGQAASHMLVGVVLGIAVLLASYFGIDRAPATTWWPYLGGITLIILSVVAYRRQWSKTAEEFVPRNPDSPTSTDEQLRQEWELEHLSRLREHENAHR